MRLVGATAARVLRQLRHDPRTIALMLAVPVVLMGLLAWTLSSHAFDAIGPQLLGIFPLIVMFLVTSVATLRERTSGTLERLLAMPIGRADIVLGYALAFGSVAIVQGVLVAGLCFGPFGMSVAGPAGLVILLAVLDALLGTALGLAMSALARTEFQAVQFMPAFILPQLLLCGIVVPRAALPPVLHAISWVLPMSYAVGAAQQLTAHAQPTATLVVDLMVIVAFLLVALVVGAATLRRQTR
jgi:ABC-2 type transport system permease protein